VERCDHREEEPIADRAEREVPRWIEPRRELGRDEMAEARDERPDRGFLQRDPLVLGLGYDFFFP
jgi:hypothetical protein